MKKILETFSLEVNLIFFILFIVTLIIRRYFDVAIVYRRKEKNYVLSLVGIIGFGFLTISLALLVKYILDYFL